MAKTQKYYVVWKGRTPGVYLTWDDCKAQVEGFADAKYKSFESRSDAAVAYGQPHTQHITSRPAGSGGSSTNTATAVRARASGKYILDSYCVDAACSGNPGDLEFKCVHTDSGEVIFKHGPYPDGTNNIGEFLATVQALMWLKQKGSALPVYSDSKIAMGWVRAGVCRTKAVHTQDNAILFMLIDQAEKWLRENKYDNKLLKWETEEWGEIPADYGRKNTFRTM